MRRLTLLVCVVAGILAAVALGAPTLSDESWVGSQYGWTSDPPRTCTPRVDVCSTENGGASWHGIFNGGTFVFGVVRTSRTAGVVSTGRQIAERFWTRDNGRHWYRASQIAAEFQGSGKYLFSINLGRFQFVDFARVLYRVQPWPPTGKARCRGVWTGAAYDTEPVKGGNVCSGPPIDAGMRSSPAVTLEEGRFASLANVPGGVIATISDSPVPRVLLYRLGKPRVVDLPPVGKLMPCTGFNTEPLVTWPRITVLGCRQEGIGEQAGVWLSGDGGATWRALPG